MAELDIFFHPVTGVILVRGTGNVLHNRGSQSGIEVRVDQLW